MTNWLVLLLIATAFGGPAVGPAAEHRLDAMKTVVLPDPAVTPGKVATTDLHRICTTKWGRDARHVTPAMKAEAYRIYGATETFKIVKGKKVPDTTSPNACCEVDHLISKELGGADDQKNLWVQKWSEARIKDRVENWLHRQVCAGRLQLQDVQRGIAADWTQYLKMMEEKK